MYDEELDTALEDAYDDGYVQALIDMGVDPNDIAEEDVDMFDDYDEAMEGPAREYRRRNNIGKSQTYIRGERKAARDGATISKVEKPRKTFENMPNGLEKNYEQGAYKRKMQRYDESIRRSDTLEGRNIMRHSNEKKIDELHSGGMSRIGARRIVNSARDKQYGRRVY